MMAFGTAWISSKKVYICKVGAIYEQTLISLFDIRGELIMQKRFQRQDQMEMDVNLLAKGLYFLKIQTPNRVESKS